MTRSSSDNNLMRRSNGTRRTVSPLDASSIDEDASADPLSSPSRAPELEALYEKVQEECRRDEQQERNNKQSAVMMNGTGRHDDANGLNPSRNSHSATATAHHPTSLPSPCAILVGAAANLCSATLGAGVLALPFAMREAGLIVGVLLLLASALVTVVSIRLLVAAQTAADLHSMERLVAFYLGPTMKQLVEACVVIFCLGCSVSYVIAVGDILYITLGWHRLSSMVLTWVTLMMPLSMFRHMKSFQWTSGTGVAAIGTLVFSSFLHLVNDDFGQQHGGHNRWDTNDTWAEDIMYGPYVVDLGGNSTTSDNPPVNLADYLWPANGIVSVLKACPIVMFAFSCQINVPSIYQELNDQQLMHKVSYLSVSVCFLLYASISIIALADFGDRIEPNILVNYKHDSGMMQFATASMAAAVITAFPLNVFPSRIAVIGVWKRYVERQQRRCGRERQRHETLTVALLEDQAEDHASVGSDGSQYGTISRSMSLDVASDREASPERHDNLVADEVDEHNDESFDLRLHIAVTLLLTGLALGLAILIPDISVVFGLLGGTTTSVLGFIVPGALALRLNNRRLACVASILLVGGILISILTTSVTVYSTFQDDDSN